MGFLNTFSTELAPDGKRKSFRVFGITAAVIIFCILSWVIWALFLPAKANDEIVSVTIPAKGLPGVTAALKEKGLIKSPWLFGMYATVSGARSDLKAGSYAIHSNVSAVSMLHQIKIGKRGDEKTLKVIEGWTEDQVVAELNKIGLPISESELDVAFQILVTADKGGANKYAALFEGITDTSVGTLSAEGYLYPDTYKVFANATAAEVLTKMLDNMKSKLTAEDLVALKASRYSFYELLTVASIVEREVSIAADRKVVGGIFLRRLGDAYPLQSDATVNYVTGKKTTTPSFNDTKVQSAYNTYQHPGLPPTPISNPSITAIQGVLHPVASEYYFFLTTKEGDAKYSKTYDEHLKYKQQYYGN